MISSTHKPLVFLFSGQGSHYFQMGKLLFQKHFYFRKWMHELDLIVQKKIGTSILEKIYDVGKKQSHPFDRILWTHPAIFMVEYALCMVLKESGIRPDIVMGVSLGEFTAGTIAGVMETETCLDALLTQAKLLETHCPSGGMLAIIDKPGYYYEAPVLYENSELAAVNYQGHFVVSASQVNIERIVDHLKAHNIVYQQLPVSFAFHSSMIEAAKAPYIDYLKSTSFCSPNIPFVSCLKADFLTTVDTEFYWQVIRKPIAFENTIKALELNKNHNYLDMGPSGTLCTFIKHILPAHAASKSYAIMTPFGNELQNLEAAIRLFRPIQTNPKLKIHGDNKRMLAYVFTGQGSQFKGMGAGLFEKFEALTAQVDRILGYPIKTLCLEDPDGLLNQTHYTQPAVYVVNALIYYKRLNQEGRKPDYVAGHSVGEYNALLAAEVFDFETGLKLVKKRAELMDRASGGRMAAVIGLSADQVEETLRHHTLADIEIANYNSPFQIVVAGPRSQIEAAQEVFIRAGAKHYIPLNVSGAFHTSQMEEAQLEFGNFIESFAFSKPVIPIISNFDARPYDSSRSRFTLTQQITSPVRWTESIQYILGRGNMEFKEIGAKPILTGLIRQIKEQAGSVQIAGDENRIRMQTQPAATQVYAFTAESLGNAAFKKEHNLKYAYVSGSMYKGISSEELIVKMARANLLGFYGTGGIHLDRIETAIQAIQNRLKDGQVFGMNLLYHPNDPELEERTVDLFLKYNVRRVEASAYMDIRPSLVRYRLKGLRRNSNGKVLTENKIMAKVSRPEVARAFLSPAPAQIVKRLLMENKITEKEAEAADNMPMADDLCAESDSAGHTDQGVAFTLIPTIVRLRDAVKAQYGYEKFVRVGSAGGIGTPEAAAAAFILGADFILTGSINQCTVEAAISDHAKDLLQNMNIQDTAYAPAGDMFEWGAKVQVLRKGLFFPSRANKLYDLYRNHAAWEDIDGRTRKQIEKKYFMATFEEIYEQVRQYHSSETLQHAEENPKHKMALVFKWYFHHSGQLALTGSDDRKVDYQIHCGPALGAFNQWVKGTGLEDWPNRHVDAIAILMMKETARVLTMRMQQIRVHNEQ